MTRPDYDHEIAEALKARGRLQEEFAVVKRGYDTFHEMRLREAIAAADAKLSSLYAKQQASTDPLRSSAVFYGSDH